MFGRHGRLTWALVAGGALIVVIVAVAAATEPGMGSGQISFGPREHHLQLTMTRVVFGPTAHRIAFVAHLTHSPGVETVTAEFQKSSDGSWQTVWKLRPILPSGSNTVLGYTYRRHFLRKKGVSAPGRYRLVVAGRRGEILARGRFRLVT